LDAARHIGRFRSPKRTADVRHPLGCQHARPLCRTLQRAVLRLAHSHGHFASDALYLEIAMRRLGSGSA
jgi:hypothetical protein